MPLVLFIPWMIAQVTAILGILVSIKTLMEHTVQEHFRYFIEDTVRESWLKIINPYYGLQALGTKIDNIAIPEVGGLLQADVDNSIYAVNRLSLQWVDQYEALDAKLDVIIGNIGAIPPPTTPPTAGEISDEVWEHEVYVTPIGGTTANVTAGTQLMQAWTYAQIQNGSEGSIHPNNPYFRLVTENPDEYMYNRYDWLHNTISVLPTIPDWSEVLVTDTPLSFLLRTQPSIAWSLTGPWTALADGETVWADAYTGTVVAWWRSNFSRLDMLQLAALTPPPDPPVVTVNAAPVWPGAANVTMGSPTALGLSVTVSGPMDGVVIAITTQPTGLGKFAMGNFTWWYRLGQIAFVSDGGDAEPWQYISWNQALYTPTRMKQAGSAIVRLLAGAEGTATPWTID